MDRIIPKIDFVSEWLKVEKKGQIPAIRKGNTAIGYTLETGEFDIPENNTSEPDFIDTNEFKDMAFELKSQRYETIDGRKKNPKRRNYKKISLVTQAPHGGKTNQELLDEFGWRDGKNRNRKNLYATVSSNRYINSKYESIRKMKIKREKEILHLVSDQKKIAYVDMSQIIDKLENLVVVKANAELKKCDCNQNEFHDKDGYHEYFDYQNAYIYTGFNKSKFYDLVDQGKVVYDLRMHKPEGVTGTEDYDTKHDHGTGFRINLIYIREMYDNERII